MIIDMKQVIEIIWYDAKSPIGAVRLPAEPPSLGVFVRPNMQTCLNSRFM